MLQLLKKAVLPKEYFDAHPKRLRFAVFTVIGRLVSHGRQMLLRVASEILRVIVDGRLNVVDALTRLAILRRVYS